jgi:hypothetical protein
MELIAIEGGVEDVSSDRRERVIFADNAKNGIE